MRSVQNWGKKMPDQKLMSLEEIRRLEQNFGWAYSQMLIETARAAHEYKLALYGADDENKDLRNQITHLKASFHREREENEKLREQLKEEKKLSEAISRDCNQTALERNSLREQLRTARNLVKALDSAFISSWQSTASWSKELDECRTAIGDAE